MAKGQVDKLVATTERMTRAADGKQQVTLKMVMSALKLKCSEKTARRALHGRGARFHAMREKPVRADADVKDRLAFAKAHAAKPASYWRDKVRAHMGNRSSPSYPDAAARVFAAKRAARGAYMGQGRQPGQGPCEAANELEGLAREECDGGSGSIRKGRAHVPRGGRPLERGGGGEHVRERFGA